MNILNLINEIGSEQIEQTILKKTERFMKHLEEIGCELLTTSTNENRSGIVSFRMEDIESAIIHEKLKADDIICSLREGWVRVACHFLNSDEQLERVINCIKDNIRS